MDDQPINQKICSQCGSVLAPNIKNCPTCANLSDLNKHQSGGRIWLAFGLFFIFVSIGILVGTFWYVEKRRSIKTTTSSFIPITNTTNSSSTNVDLAKLSSQDLLGLVPVKVLSRYKTISGDNLPDQISIINQDGEQYLVLLGSERMDSDNSGQKKFLASVLKLEGGSLSDISKETLPGELETTKIVDVQLFNKGPDFDIKIPIKSDLIETCFDNECEQAYYIQQVMWCGTDYQLGIKNWSNEPFTVLYIFAQALEQRKLPNRDRIFVAQVLDPLILEGFDRNSNQKWQITNLTTNNLFELKTLDKVSYNLSNGTNTITINVEKQENGLWQVTSLGNPETDSSSDSVKTSPENNPINN